MVNPLFRLLPTLLISGAAALATLTLTSCVSAQEPAGPGPGAALDANRVREIAAMLPAQPQGLGHPIGDRAYWNARAAMPEYQDVIKRAEALLKTPLEAQPDDLYLEFSRNGNRTRWQTVANRRRGRIVTYALAESLENKGRFLKPLEEVIAAVCAEKTWLMPAHDGKLDNFNGKVVDIDLASSALAWNMATINWVLGDKLTPATRALIKENVDKRVIVPFGDMFAGRRKRNWWMDTTNNWNAVCLAGSVGSALAQIPERERRAEYVAAGEHYIKNFLKGFTSDGYCSEGLSYWNYGFGNFVYLSETLRAATDAKIDLLARPEAKAPATFASRIEIIGGVSPAFADCPINARPDAAIMYIINRRLNLGLPAYADLPHRSTLGNVFEAGIFSAVETAAPPTGAAPPRAARDWFDQAGILISRPAPGAATRMGVAMKGGHNEEHHNHNDIGSYVVVIGEQPVLLDPGNETYTARTFSSKRYDSKLLNSYGHPVPVVGETLQKEGRKSAAKVLKSDFTADTDTLVLDIASAYPNPDLTKLERTFVYSRQGAGSLTVTDRVTLKSPQPFQTAILTMGEWKKQPDGSIVVYDVEEAAKVEIDTGGRAYTIVDDVIREDAPVAPTRLGIKLNEPVTDATVTVRVTPLAMENAGGGLLRNGGFETGRFGWRLDNAMSAISTERAATGTASLKITDATKTGGSNILSSRIPVPGPGKYILRGKVYTVSGGGIGMYVRSLDKERNRLNPTTAGGDEAPVGSLTGGKPGEWETFSFPVTALPGTESLQIWIHTFNASQVEAFLDDLEIVPAP